MLIRRKVPCPNRRVLTVNSSLIRLFSTKAQIPHGQINRLRLKIRAQPSLASYSRLLTLLTKSKQYSSAVQTFADMKQNGVTPDIVVFTAMITVYLGLNLPRQALTVAEEMKNSVGVELDAISYNKLIRVSIKLNQHEDIQKTLQKMKQNDIQLDKETAHLLTTMETKTQNKQPKPKNPESLTEPQILEILKPENIYVKSQSPPTSEIDKFLSRMDPDNFGILADQMEPNTKTKRE